ncbi:MAG: HEPN domain-containing protein [Armatimonadota bacterium]|nr:HEPN domain-containing protein [Armatimonadota bacterium]MDW8156171.1 HEPN domain-containing protein [Armatimonadota bacterium]
MTNSSLGRAYLDKARKRLPVLDLLYQQGAYSDVVREAQEVVELALKGALRLVGVEPPKLHDVGPVLLEHADRFPAEVQTQLRDLARISKWLRKEREFSFYGDVDFIPTLEYTAEDADRARRDAQHVVSVCTQLLNPGG